MIYISYILFIYMKSELGSPTAMMQTFASKGMRSWRLSCRTCRKRRCGCGKHWTTSGPSWHVWLVDVLVFGDWMLSVSLYCDSTSVASVSMAQWAQSVLGMKSGQWDSMPTLQTAGPLVTPTRPYPSLGFLKLARQSRFTSSPNSSCWAEVFCSRRLLCLLKWPRLTHLRTSTNLRVCVWVHVWVSVCGCACIHAYRHANMIKHACAPTCLPTYLTYMHVCGAHVFACWCRNVFAAKNYQQRLRFLTYDLTE